MLTLLGLMLPFAACAAMGILCSTMMRNGGCRPAGLSSEEARELAGLRAELDDLRSRLDDPSGVTRSRARDGILSGATGGGS